MSRTENREYNNQIKVTLTVRDASYLNYILNTNQWGSADLRQIIALEDGLNGLEIKDGMSLDGDYGSFSLSEDRWRWVIKASEKTSQQNKVPRWAIRSALFFEDDLPLIIKENKSGTKATNEDVK